jgi:hypothetical protein
MPQPPLESLGLLELVFRICGSVNTPSNAGVSGRGTRVANSGGSHDTSSRNGSRAWQYRNRFFFCCFLYYCVFLIPGRPISNDCYHFGTVGATSNAFNHCDTKDNVKSMHCVLGLIPSHDCLKRLISSVRQWCVDSTASCLCVDTQKSR